jgi:hypothetical protein
MRSLAAYARTAPAARLVTAACMSTVGDAACSAMVASSAIAAKAMAAPAVAITPAGPWAHAEEDAVIEIA